MTWDVSETAFFVPSPFVFFVPPFGAYIGDRKEEGRAVAMKIRLLGGLLAY